MIYTKYFPPEGYTAMVFFGTIVQRKNKTISLQTLNHEGIHICQAEDFGMKFAGGIIFYIIYGIEGFIKALLSCFTFGKIRAYRSISFEQEAYINSKDYKYQDTRKKFTGLQYIFSVIRK